MTRRPRDVLVALGLLLLSGCSRGGVPAGEAVTMRDSAGVTIVTNDLKRLTRSCALAPEPRVMIGDRVGDPSSELYRVFGAAVLNDGRITVVNQGTQELRFYAPTGDLLSASGREGSGPGEFHDAFLLWKQPGDTLWVGDYRPWEFEIFSPDGEWVRMVRPEPLYPNPPRGIGLLSDGRMILATEGLPDPRADFGLRQLRLLLHDAHGVLADTLAVLPNGRWGQTRHDPGAVWLYPWFESFAEFTVRGDQLILGHGSSAELRIYDMRAGMELAAILRWSGADQGISDADINAARREIEERYADADRGMREQLVDPLLDDTRPVADRMPAFSDVVSGSDGSIWIRQYRRPGGPRAAEWIRFDRQGRFVCRLEVPSGLEVYEFGTDYVLGKAKDALEVEFVVLFDLSVGRWAVEGRRT